MRLRSFGANTEKSPSTCWTGGGMKALISEKAYLPGAANKLLRALRIMMRLAIEEDMTADELTSMIQHLKGPGGWLHRLG